MLILSPGDKNSSAHQPYRLPRAPLVLEVTLILSALGTMETLKTLWLLCLHGQDDFRSVVIIKHPQTQSSGQQRLSQLCSLLTGKVLVPYCPQSRTQEDKIYTAWSTTNQSHGQGKEDCGKDVCSKQTHFCLQFPSRGESDEK